MLEKKIKKYVHHAGSKSCNLVIDIITHTQDILGKKLVGVYLHGSLTTGHFQKKNSDVDLLAVFSGIISKNEQMALKHMHDQLLLQYPVEYKHIDLEYRPWSLMKSCKADATNPQVFVMRYGNFFKARRANDIGWLINLFVVRRHAVSLSGPSIKKIIPSISLKTFKETVRIGAKQWRREVVKTKDSLPYQAYAVLTLCRAFCLIKSGRQLSKLQAAEIIKKQFPEWSDLILLSVSNYSGKKSHRIDVKSNYQKTKAFVDFIIYELESSRSEE